MVEQVDYRQMWQELNLNLKNHDALLHVLGELYPQTFMKQENRPKGMEYLDYVMSEVHGLRIKELMDAKTEGRKVIGTYCTFVPEEIVLAADAVMVGLCAGADFATEQAEKYLPRNTCALIKSTFGFKLGGVCPYLEVSDMVVGENTCDGKKKAWEIFNTIINKMYIMDLPQKKSEDGRTLLKSEYWKFLQAVEELTGKKITVDALQKATNVVNNKRKAIYRLSQLRQHRPSPISGLDSLLINQVFFYDDPKRFTNSINTLCDELEMRVEKKEGVGNENTPRILVSGCPMAVPNWKIPSIVESNGAVIVGEESCIGERGTRNLVEQSTESVEKFIDNLIDRYFQIDCAVFSPNTERLDHIIEMVDTYKADGVLLYGLNFCSPYQIESMQIEKELHSRNINSLKIETDYSQEDVEQISTRVQAFIEMIQN